MHQSLLPSQTRPPQREKRTDIAVKHFFGDIMRVTSLFLLTHLTQFIRSVLFSRAACEHEKKHLGGRTRLEIFNLRTLITSFTLSTCLLLTSCQKPDNNTLVIGTISGPETTLMEVAKNEAWKKYQLPVKIVEFSDYNLPNAALEDGSLDANAFQHLPYLKASEKAHDYHLTPIAKTFLYPTAIYSDKYKKLKDLPLKATIAIPNDPSNEARALLLLAKAQLIELKTVALPSARDITQNPKLLRFKEIDAAQLPRVLADVDAAVINTNYAVPAGLNPQKALLMEDKNSPYVNLIVVKINSPKQEKIQQFVHAYQSDAVKQKAHELFGDNAIPGW